MEALIKMCFLLETDNADYLDVIKRMIDLEPCEVRTPKAQWLAKPYWSTEISEYANEVSPVFQLLESRIQPKLAVLRALRQRYDVHPFIVMTVVADFEHRPFISLSPQQIRFINSLEAELVFNLESIFPDPDNIESTADGTGCSE